MYTRIPTITMQDYLSKMFTPSPPSSGGITRGSQDTLLNHCSLPSLYLMALTSLETVSKGATSP